MGEQVADEGAFTQAVGSGEGDAAGAAEFQVGVVELAFAAQGQETGGQAKEEIPGHVGSAIDPDAGFVAFFHRDLGALRGHLARALVHLRNHLAGVGVFAGHFGEVSLGAAIVVVGGDFDLFGAARRRRFLVGDDAAALRLGLEAGFGAA